jgi:endoglycosylceramidase
MAALTVLPVLPLGHAGRWTTDARGRVLVVHGTAMVYKVAPYYPAAAGFGADDGAFLARLGFNAVRVGVIWKAVEPSPGFYDDAYLARIGSTVRMLARHGILSLLDFHQDLYNERFQGEGAPDWAVLDDGLPAQPRLGFPYNYFEMAALQHAFDHFFENSAGPGGVGLVDRFAAMWRHVASFFRDSPGLLGYEVLNEPFPGSVYSACGLPTGCSAFDAELTAFDRKVARAIRSVDSRTPIWYEPNVAFNFGFVTDVGSLADRNAGFAFHDYCLTPAASSCPTQDKPYQYALAHVAQTHEALLASEFHADIGLISLADSHMIPWLDWSYCYCRDPTTTESAPLVHDPAKPPNGANVGIGVRAAEPYPQLISGTPTGWRFDRASSTFTASWSVARAGRKGRFPAGALTAIAIPPRVYPTGYAARVTGGVPVTPPRAGTLLVAACPHASVVSVTVTVKGRTRGSCRRPTRRRRP